MKKVEAAPERTRLSLSEQAYAAIKERIITLYFAPGQYLNEGAIAEALALGRTPVHQALQRLQLEGLVDIVPRKGVIIQPDSMRQVLDILDARLVVEPAIARRAATDASKLDVARLRAILDGGTSSHDAGQHGGGAIDAFVECDRAFHDAVCSIAGGGILADFAKTLHERSTRAWYLHLWQTLDVQASDRQHRNIVVAIAARDPDGASRAMSEHLEALRKRVLNMQQQAPRPRRPG